MLKGRIALAPASLGLALAGCPVLVTGPGGQPGTITLRGNGQRFPDVPAADLVPASLWAARGREWKGPYIDRQGALQAFTAWDPVRGADITESLLQGESSPLGAEIISGGWRYRLAWGGDTAPTRFDSPP